MDTMRSSPSDTARTNLKCDVLVIGYGPVGMTAAALLVHYGLDVIVVERHDSRFQWHRAGHFDGETMRVFQRLGVAEAIELVAQPMPSMDMRTSEGEVLATIESGQAGSGWKSDYIAYQPDYERVIDARARELGARILMSTRADSLTETADGVVTVVRSTDASEGSASTIESRWVVGADGANSFVRSAIGAESLDLGFHAQPHIVIDFEFSDPDAELPQLPDAAQVLDPLRPQLVGRWGGRRHTRWEIAALEGESSEDLASEEFCWRLLGAWGIGPEHGRIERRAVYDYASSISAPWRVGRVLLAGDAAHTMPPHLGQGMQSGIRDAENLAWKLAAVSSSAADDSLLDTYETERQPHALALVRMSSALGSTILLSDPAQIEIRNQMFRSGTMPTPSFPRLGPGILSETQHGVAPDALESIGRPSRQARVARGEHVDRLDNLLSKTGWRIVSRHPVPMSVFTGKQRRLLDALDMQFAHVSRGASGEESFWDIDAEFDPWYAESGHRVFLERPDHYVFGTAETIEDLPALVDDLSEKLAVAGWHIP